MTDFTPDQVVGALRATAEFCRDPKAPKCTGSYAENVEGYGFRRDAYGVVERIEPTDADAAQWCAMGYLSKQLGIIEYNTLVSFQGIPFPDYSAIYPEFDRKARVCNGWLRNKTAHQEAMEPVARLFDDMADRIEALNA